MVNTNHNGIGLLKKIAKARFTPIENSRHKVTKYSLGELMLM